MTTPEADRLQFASFERTVTVTVKVPVFTLTQMKFEFANSCSFCAHCLNMSICTIPAGRKVPSNNIKNRANHSFPGRGNPTVCFQVMVGAPQNSLYKTFIVCFVLQNLKWKLKCKTKSTIHCVM